jgi:hypothetical protein
MNSNNIDEFGRDITLRKPKNNTTYYFKALNKSFKSRNWADICDEIEDEIDRIALESVQKQNAERQLIIEQLTSERKKLLRKGLYDLEEGEILE